MTLTWTQSPSDDFFPPSTLYSPLCKPLHEYVHTFRLKLPSSILLFRKNCFGKDPQCSLLTASKTLSFPVLWLSCAFWFNNHQQANPVLVNTATYQKADKHGRALKTFLKQRTKREPYSLLTMKLLSLSWTVNLQNSFM